jgi:hypothetical protein
MLLTIDQAALNYIPKDCIIYIYMYVCVYIYVLKTCEDWESGYLS